MARIFRFPRPAGFTLLEVMIALAILALVGVAFLRAQAGSVRLVDEASQISLATLLAKEKMAELESVGFSEPSKTTGTGGKEYPSMKWEQAISLTEVLNLRKAQVRVFWMEGQQERSLELTAYFARR